MERYECLGKIGEGAAGVVHVARDRTTGETVAVKRLHGGIGCGEEEWLREARCLQACRGHPHLVELRAAHREMRRGGGACCYVVMEYVDGPSLSRVVRRSGAGGRSGGRDAAADAAAPRRRRGDARGGGHAPGPQAGQRRRRPPRRPQDLRLRHVAGRHGRRAAVHVARRHAVVPRAGAHPGVAGVRLPRRHVVARMHHGRAPRRRSALPREVGDGPAEQGVRHGRNAGHEVVAGLRSPAARRVRALQPRQAAEQAPGDVPQAVRRRVRRAERAARLPAGQAAHRGGRAPVRVVHGG